MCLCLFLISLVPLLPTCTCSTQPELDIYCKKLTHKKIRQTPRTNVFDAALGSLFPFLFGRRGSSGSGGREVTLWPCDRVICPVSNGSMCHLCCKAFDFVAQPQENNRKVKFMFISYLRELGSLIFVTEKKFVSYQNHST